VRQGGCGRAARWAGRIGDRSCSSGTAAHVCDHCNAVRAAGRHDRAVIALAHLQHGSRQRADAEGIQKLEPLRGLVIGLGELGHNFFHGLKLLVHDVEHDVASKQMGQKRAALDVEIHSCKRDGGTRHQICSSQMRVVLVTCRAVQIKRTNVPCTSSLVEEAGDVSLPWQLCFLC
jgi:hypothetical protein